MSGFHIVIMQDPAARTAPPAPPARPAAPDVPSGDLLREQIRQTIQTATQAAREARDGHQQSVRDAQQQVRDAEQQLRDARTPDQRGAAEQALFGARAELRSLQGGRLMTSTSQPSMPPQDFIPPQAVDISIAFFIMFAVIIIGWPLARAMGRRLERRADVPAMADPAMAGQLQRIEQAVEAMSIEIERISESQRFMAKLQSGSAAERSALGSGERR